MVKAAKHCRTPKRGRESEAHCALASWSAAVLRRFHSRRKLKSVGINLVLLIARQFGQQNSSSRFSRTRCHSRGRRPRPFLSDHRRNRCTKFRPAICWKIDKKGQPALIWKTFCSEI